MSASKVSKFCSECGKKATRTRTIDQTSKLCEECSNQANLDTNSEEDRRLSMIKEHEAENSESEVISQELSNNSKDYWANMNKLLDVKFKSFEQSFKDSLMTEVKQITDPIAKEVKELKTENNKLKTEITLLKAKGNEHGEKMDKVEKTLKEHQKTLAQNDKSARYKRLILAGMPEEEVEINGNKLNNDREKVLEVLKIMKLEINSVNVRRIGKKDQGAEKRPRYIMLEFSSIDERNQVKKKSSVLKDNECTKSLYLKADLTKKTREEYKRLYEMKDRILEESPDKAVKIDYGKLYVNDVVIDQIDDKDFL